jgi:small subunit ribosomal protein S2
MSKKLEYKELLDAGVHFGHLTRKWDPKMAPYIFTEKNGIHIIDLNKTISSLDIACEAVKNIVRSGRKIMFVATKKQAKDVVVDQAAKLNMPYVTERWLGGMLTNFTTVRKSIKKMSSIAKLEKDETYKYIAKRERLMLTREKNKLNRVLGGISDLTRLPAALFVIDVKKEHIAIAEAKKLNIPVFAVCDTNSNPEAVDFAIPGNDDSFQAVKVLVDAFSDAIAEGLAERKRAREEQKKQEEVDAKKAADQAEASVKTEKTEDSEKVAEK